MKPLRLCDASAPCPEDLLLPKLLPRGSPPPEVVHDILSERTELFSNQARREVRHAIDHRGHVHVPQRFQFDSFDAQALAMTLLLARVAGHLHGTFQGLPQALHEMVLIRQLEEDPGKQP